MLCLLAQVTHDSNCILGNNRIAGLFTVLFKSNASHNLLQQPKPSILSFIATFVQAENCTEYIIIYVYIYVQNMYYLPIFPRLSAAIIGLTVNKTVGYNASHWCLQGHNTV